MNGKIFLIVSFVIILTVSLTTNAQVGAGGTASSSLQVSGGVTGKIFAPVGKLVKGLEKKVAKSATTKTTSNNKVVSSTRPKTGKSKTTSAKTTSTKTKIPIQTDDDDSTVSTAPLNYAGLTFKPTKKSTFPQEIAGSLTTDAQFQSALIEIMENFKSAYEVEARKEGKSNNIAMAMSVYLAVCVTAYRDQPEPSDNATENLFNQISSSFAAEESLTELSNAEKQNLHDGLIYLSAIVYAGYSVSKQTNDKPTLQIYQALAGGLIEQLMGVKPDKLNISESGLVIES